MEKKVHIYSRFERFWHWSQAGLLIIMIITGFEIHGTWHLFGFEKATDIHNLFAWIFLGLTSFAIFWHLTTGAWKQYVPTTKKIKEMIHFYLVGIFKGEHHPVKKTELSKLNPLQRLTYAVLKVLVLPGFLWVHE